MLNLNVEKMGDVTVIRCEGRIVRSDAAFRLRDAVTQQRDARVVLLDLSGVDALEGGGLGMLLFLQVWTRDHGIQLKSFDLPARVRQSLERAHYASRVEIAATGEVQSLLSSGPAESWEPSRAAA
jgi:anti-anti-sigma regulatory factor